jgi:DNA repair exonuclease SbcCD ATPase subunit
MIKLLFSLVKVYKKVIKMTQNEKSLIEDLTKREHELRQLRKELTEIIDKYNAAKKIIKEYSKLI